MKSRQFCSVCKQWLDMEVVPTGDGDDDGVVWYRCPQCQGFLPKLSATAATDGILASKAAVGHAEDAAPDEADAGDDDALVGVVDDVGDGDLDAGAGLDDAGLDGDGIDGDGIDGEDADGGDEGTDDDDAAEDDDEMVGRPPLPAGVPSEPIHEYAAMLADVDPEQSVPYRPWESYEVGQCILHLAWNDCGVVVAKEQLPGGRSVIKCWFQGAGVVRLIENAPR